MLIKILIENFKSFDKKEELSLFPSKKVNSYENHKVNIENTYLLKNAIIYGANASGKSNIVMAIAFIKNVIANGTLPDNSFDDFCKNKIENKNRESFFEIQFTVDNKFYAYGFSALLSQQEITEEWLYELYEDGSAQQLFIREGDNAPRIGDNISLSNQENNKFSVYSEDFAGQKERLFLTEMNRGKKYNSNSNLLFFYKIFTWIINNIIVLTPTTGIFNIDIYNSKSLEAITSLIKTFDTGVTKISTKKISIDEMVQKVNKRDIDHVLSDVKNKMQMTNTSQTQIAWKVRDNFFFISIKDCADPEVTTLVFNHGKSELEFSFAEESDGTKRLFDLISMLIIKQEDTVFIIDELERSLHPKLTEHFLKIFMDVHDKEIMQLIFTTHEDTIMDQNLFRRDEIWFVERDANNASILYSLDRFKERYDKELSRAYLDGRYGAIPVFRQFTSYKEK